MHLPRYKLYKYSATIIYAKQVKHFNQQQVRKTALFVG